MNKQIQTLHKITSRKGSSKTLTFSTPHTLKAIQLLSREKFVSRAQFHQELLLGEGAVKTLIRRLKDEGIADTTKAGTFLTQKGLKIADFFIKSIPNECKVEECDIASKKHNHAIVLRGYAGIVKTGLEQRDYAILYGSEGCVTLTYKNGKFVFPSYNKGSVHINKNTSEMLRKNLNPQEDDIIIISSSKDPFVAEISAKNSALVTMTNK